MSSIDLQATPSYPFISLIQYPCLAKNQNGCEFEFSSIYMEEYGKLKVYFHTKHGRREECPEVSNKMMY